MGFSGKVYGETNRVADRILRTFRNRDASTGVCLAGEKGSGKTLLAKRISILAAEDNIVTIVINSALYGEEFNKFIQMIKQPCVMLFDEFEKVYDSSETKAQMLTLLDGVYPSKKLFVMTCNDKSSLDVNMRNRPGRIFYMLDFDGLDIAFIREYCQENLVECNKYVEQICAISTTFDAFNFDMLKAMVEEMNRYGESPMDVLRFLNVEPNGESDLSYAMKLFNRNGKLVKLLSRYSGTATDTVIWDGNPLTKTITAACRDETIEKEEEEEEKKEESKAPKEEEEEVESKAPKLIRFSANDLVHVDTETNSYIYVSNNNGYRLALKRILSPSPKLNFDTLQCSMRKKSDSGVQDNEINKMKMLVDDNSINDKEEASYYGYY